MMKSALLIMDMQRSVVNRYGDSAVAAVLATKLGAVAARTAGIQVVHVRLAFRQGFPEVSMRNQAFTSLASSGAMVDGDLGTQIHDELAPEPGDLIVTKKRVSAFAGNDLDLLLRSREITDIALAGIATSGVVLSTLRAAADLDYTCSVLSDGCADGDAEVQSLLMHKIFPKQGAVTPALMWVADRP